MHEAKLSPRSMARLRGIFLAGTTAIALGIVAVSGIAMAGRRPSPGLGPDDCFPTETRYEERGGVLYLCTLWFCPPSGGYWDCVPV